MRRTVGGGVRGPVTGARGGPGVGTMVVVVGSSSVVDVVGAVLVVVSEETEVVLVLRGAPPLTVVAEIVVVVACTVDPLDGVGPTVAVVADGLSLDGPPAAVCVDPPPPQPARRTDRATGGITLVNRIRSASFPDKQPRAPVATRVKGVKSAFTMVTGPVAGRRGLPGSVAEHTPPGACGYGQL